jgi:hypothetical protein
MAAELIFSKSKVIVGIPDCFVQTAEPQRSGLKLMLAGYRPK